MILHIDMDAFYASIEIRDNPDLVDKPIVVGGSPKGRGVVSAASYEARKYGIHSAMSASRALRLCPQVVFVKPRMKHYADISKHIREIFFRFTSLVEPIALDEAFLDVSGCERLFGPAKSIAEQIKQAIADEVNLPASAGVAPNKFLAKVASDLDKPNGLTIVEPGTEQEFLDPLPISRIWGVGPKTERKFNSLGVRTVAHIRQLPLDSLQRAFGVNSEHFWRLSRGLDSRPVVPDRHAKTISHETTFSFDIDHREMLAAWLLELTEQVGMRMRRYRIRGRTINLKIRYSDFHTITRAVSLSEATSTTRIMYDAALEVLEREIPAQHEPVRLLGMGVSNLVQNEFTQMTLFDDGQEKLDRLDKTCDDLREKFGKDALRSGTSMQHHINLRPDPRVQE